VVIDVLACSVCWGAAQDPVVHGTKLSIVFLLVLVYLLLGGGVGMVFMARRRARKLQLQLHSEMEPAREGLS
jgi:hypothetical protein